MRANQSEFTLRKHEPVLEGVRHISEVLQEWAREHRAVLEERPRQALPALCTPSPAVEASRQTVLVS
jgi:hypothetical protein